MEVGRWNALHMLLYKIVVWVKCECRMKYGIN
jgi:hypothetical protein